MCQRDINRFLHEPFLAVALSQVESTYCTESAECSVWDQAVFFTPLGAAFLTVETTTNLFKRIIEFFCVYVLC